MIIISQNQPSTRNVKLHKLKCKAWYSFKMKSAQLSSEICLANKYVNHPKILTSVLNTVQALCLAVCTMDRQFQVILCAGEMLKNNPWALFCPLVPKASYRPKAVSRHLPLTLVAYVMLSVVLRFTTFPSLKRVFSKIFMRSTFSFSSWIPRICCFL